MSPTSTLSTEPKDTSSILTSVSSSQSSKKICDPYPLFKEEEYDLFNQKQLDASMISPSECVRKNDSDSIIVRSLKQIKAAKLINPDLIRSNPMKEMNEEFISLDDSGDSDDIELLEKTKEFEIDKRCGVSIVEHCEDFMCPMHIDDMLIIVHEIRMKASYKNHRTIMLESMRGAQDKAPYDIFEAKDKTPYDIFEEKESIE